MYLTYIVALSVIHLDWSAQVQFILHGIGKGKLNYYYSLESGINFLICNGLKVANIWRRNSTLLEKNPPPKYIYVHLIQGQKEWPNNRSSGHASYLAV